MGAQGKRLGGYVDSVTHNLRNVARFSGRTSGARFWPYALTVVFAAMLIMAAAIVPMFIEAFQKMLAYAAEHPEQATVTRTATSVSVSINGAPPDLMPSYRAVVPAIWLVVLMIVGLLGAAIARRLHDVDSSIVWGVAPMPFIAFSLVMFSQLIDRFATSGEFGDLFGFLIVSNMIYLLALGNLLIRLCQRSQPGTNRFGPPER